VSRPPGTTSSGIIDDMTAIAESADAIRSGFMSTARTAHRDFFPQHRHLIRGIE